MTSAPTSPPPVAAPEQGTAAAAPASRTQTLDAYLRDHLRKIRSGESGLLPVLLGLVVITAVFQAISPHNVYLSPGNLVNLFQQSAVFMVLAMAEGFALLLGEIDLSAGYVAGVGGVIGVQLVQPTTTNWPWWGAIAAALLVTTLIGALQGTLITRLRLPSFIVTLAGLLIFNGVMLILLLLGPFNGYPSLAGRGGNLKVLYDLMWGELDPLVGWVGLAVVVAALGGLIWLRDGRRRRSGLVASPVSITLLKIFFIAAVGVAVVAISNLNRANVGVVQGVPWVIPIVLVVLGAWTVLLERTKFGRYVYAIGGNPEAALRAGISLAGIRTWAFALCGLTAGVAGLLYASYLGGMSNNVNGGQLVLYAVAAAVIGGTSLFGGRGRMMHGVFGGLVIGAIYNGMYLLGLDVKWEFIITGLVLLAAVTIDSVSRRGATTGSVTHV